MKLDTKKRSHTIKSRFLIFAVLEIAILVYIWFFDPFKNNSIPLTITILFVLSYIFVDFYKFKYIIFSDENNFIVLRYFQLIPTNINHNSIEIPISEFFKFEIKTKTFINRKELILYQKTKKGVFVYPAISLSSMTDEQIDLMKTSLSKYTKTKK